MTLLDIPPTLVHCLGCGRLLWDPKSRKRRRGKECAEKAGLLDPPDPRFSRRDGGDCPGQTELLEEAQLMEIVRPNEPWTVAFYNGERLIDTTTMAKELDEVLMWANARWRTHRVVLGPDITVRLSQGDLTWDHEEVAAEYDRRFASAMNSWHMTTREQLDAFERKYGPTEDGRPDATVHQIFPPPEGTTP